MIALRAALVTLVLASLASSWATARYDGAWLIGLIAAVALVATFGIFRRETWTEPVRVQDVTGELPSLTFRPSPRWEKALAFIVAPIIFLAAIGLLIYGVTL